MEKHEILDHFTKKKKAKRILKNASEEQEMN